MVLLACARRHHACAIGAHGCAWYARLTALHVRRSPIAQRVLPIAQVDHQGAPRFAFHKLLRAEQLETVVERLTLLDDRLEVGRSAAPQDVRHRRRERPVAPSTAVERYRAGPSVVVDLLTHHRDGMPTD